MDYRQLPTYCINLASRPDRREAMLAKAEKVGLNLTFVTAMTPDDIGQVSLPWVHHKEYHLTMAQYACASSHLSVLRQLAQSEAPAALILEDDCLFTDDFTQRLSSLPKPPSDWGLLTLGHLFDPRTVDNEEHTFWQRFVWWSGAHAYIIKRESAQRMLAYQSRIWAPFDDMLANAGTTLFRSYHCVPSIVAQEAGYSDVDGAQVGIRH